MLYKGGGECVFTHHESTFLLEAYKREMNIFPQKRPVMLYKGGGEDVFTYNRSAFMQEHILTQSLTFSSGVDVVIYSN